MTRLKILKDEFTRLTELNPHERMLRLVAMLTKYFHDEGIKPIIVGGLSVEVYTRNNYTTYDIDIIAAGREKIGKLLTEELGFIKTGRSWYSEELELSIEIPSNHLEGSLEKVVELTLSEEDKVYLIGLEDIIIHRLESAVLNHSNNPEWSEDYEWAERMFEIHKDDKSLLDKEYLKSASSDKRVIAIIEKWIG